MTAATPRSTALEDLVDRADAIVVGRSRGICNAERCQVIPTDDDVALLVGLADIVARVELEPIGDLTSAYIVTVNEVVKGAAPPVGLLPDGVTGGVADGIEVEVKVPPVHGPGGPWTFDRQRRRGGRHGGWVFLIGSWESPTLINPVPPAKIFGVKRVMRRIGHGSDDPAPYGTSRYGR